MPFQGASGSKLSLKSRTSGVQEHGIQGISASVAFRDWGDGRARVARVQTRDLRHRQESWVEGGVWSRGSGSRGAKELKKEQEQAEGVGQVRPVHHVEALS